MEDISYITNGLLMLGASCCPKWSKCLRSVPRAAAAKLLFAFISKCSHMSIVRGGKCKEAILRKHVFTWICNMKFLVLVWTNYGCQIKQHEKKHSWRSMSKEWHRAMLFILQLCLFLNYFKFKFAVQLKKKRKSPDVWQTLLNHTMVHKMFTSLGSRRFFQNDKGISFN